MLTWSKPTEEAINQHLEDCAQKEYTYEPIGMTLDSIPAGFDVDRHCVQLGEGVETFEKAKTALREWKMFPTEMAKLFWPNTKIEKGNEVSVLFRAGILWSLNPCRIVEVIEEQSNIERFGFAYGTIEGHLERGEERFLVEWDRKTDQVTYDLLVASKPGHLLSKFGYPIVRMEQRRFRKLSGRSMQAAVT